MALFVGQKRQKAHDVKTRRQSNGKYPSKKLHEANRDSHIHLKDHESPHLASSDASSEDGSIGNAPSRYEALLTAFSQNSAVQHVSEKRRKLATEKAVSLSAPEFKPNPVASDVVAGLDSDDDSDENEADNEEPKFEQADDPFHVMFGDSQVRHNRSQKQTLPLKWKSATTSKSSDWSCTLKSIDDAHEPDPDHLISKASEVGTRHLKRKLHETARQQLVDLDECMQDLYDALHRYKDVIFPVRTTENAPILRNLACIHALNHVFKTRDKVLRNNARSVTDGYVDETQIRDQGFTRPKVLILLPTRQACVRYVDALMALSIPEQQENKKRFLETFSSEASTFSQEKPDDFRELFEGNDDDLFRVGIKFTRKTVTLFSGFYKSDIILGSPLGIRMAIENGVPKSRDHDFLSSIELVIIDQADAALMQNWEHVGFIIDNLNLQPRDAHGCDFSRIKSWYLDGKAKYFRQTVAFSAFNFPALNKLFASTVANLAGKAIFAGHGRGLLADLRVCPPQTFSKVAFQSISQEPEARFEYFHQAVLPMLSKVARTAPEISGVLIFLPSYADFLRVRNHLAAAPDGQDIAFGGISEYTSTKDTARARSHFLSAKYSTLLYTERAHHFRRYLIKGVRKVIFYGLPDNPAFFQEIIDGFIGSSIAAGRMRLKDVHVRVMFSKLDMFKLERIVGSQRCLSMLQKGKGDTFDFT